MDRSRSVAEALRFWAGCDGAIRADIIAALADVGLAALNDVPVRYLSAGQKKRAAMAMVIVQAAPVWLLDEPLNGLDGDGVQATLAAIATHLDKGGCAIIASHQPIDVAMVRSLDLAAYLA